MVDIVRLRNTKSRINPSSEGNPPQRGAEISQRGGHQIQSCLLLLSDIFSVRLVCRSIPRFLFLATLMISSCASNSIRQEEAWRREEAIDAQRDLTRFHRRSSSALGQSRQHY